MRVEVMSFGFKYDEAVTADFVFDVRCLKNPHHLPSLRDKNGLDKDVRSYVLENYPADPYMRALIRILRVSLGWVANDVVVAFGCTGGKHRSVVVAEEIAAFIIEEFTEHVTITHRELPP